MNIDSLEAGIYHFNSIIIIIIIIVINKTFKMADSVVALEFHRLKSLENIPKPKYINYYCKSPDRLWKDSG